MKKLILPPRKVYAGKLKTGFVNIIRSRVSDTECAGVYETRAEADLWKLGCWKRVACVMVAWREEP